MHSLNLFLTAAVLLCQSDKRKTYSFHFNSFTLKQKSLFIFSFFLRHGTNNNESYSKATTEICRRIVVVVALFQYSNLRIAFIMHIMLNHSLRVLLGQKKSLSENIYFLESEQSYKRNRSTENKQRGNIIVET